MYFFIYFFCSMGLGLILLVLSYLVSSKRYDSEKLSAYECGFQPFSDARETFNVRYYLVALLFVIFDLEVVFLFPWSVQVGRLLTVTASTLPFWIVLFFLLLLAIGILYEYRKGGLDWE